MILETIKRPDIKPHNLLSTGLFLRNNCGPDVRKLFNDPIFTQVKDLVIDLYKDAKRKTTEDPYIKHVYFTTFLCYNQINALGYNDIQKQIFITSALLHDAIEIKRKNHQKITKIDLYNQLIKSGIKKFEAKQITTIVSFLTPPEKDNSKLSPAVWRNKKKIDFIRIMTKIPSRRLNSELLKMAQQIKIADDVANLRETVTEVKLGYDGPDMEIYKHKHLQDRVAVFEERIKIITEKYPDNPLLLQLQGDVLFIKGCLKSK